MINLFIIYITSKNLMIQSNEDNEVGRHMIVLFKIRHRCAVRDKRRGSDLMCDEITRLTLT